MHWLSRIAPQHPKNEMVKMIEPSTRTQIGKIAGLFSGKADLMSSSLKSGMAPTTIKAIPAI